MSHRPDTISIFAAIVSVFAMFATMWAMLIDIKVDSMPTISIRQNGEEWFAENIGIGPAIEPKVTVMLPGQSTWTEGQTLFSLKSGDSIIMRSVPGEVWGVRVTYKDIYGNDYASELSNGSLKIEADLPLLFRWL